MGQIFHHLFFGLGSFKECIFSSENHTNRIETTGNNRGYINNPPLLPQFPGFLPRSSPPQWQSASHLRQRLEPWLNHPTVGGGWGS